MKATSARFTVLGIVLAIAAVVSFKAWLNAQQVAMQLQHRAELSKQETERLRLFAQAVHAQRAKRTALK